MKAIKYFLWKDHFGPIREEAAETGLKPKHNRQLEELQQQVGRFILELVEEKASGIRATAEFLGSGRYQVGPDVICLDGSKSMVLESLVELRAATIDPLARHSGVSNPSAALKSICNSTPQLARFFTLPGVKKKGGYSTAIVDGRNK